ncbi:putative ORFan [Tupanvirus deep ocean]|uniref:ORFan n=2 Tax=Tupanvirus TaxID=2094720 RepID=A0AC62A7V8_9VIRU|nr:putative ORFan [Tupanvirus deep ocean]QKU33723.1 putative ORFan [Tupanvirus deep ocean]
MSSYTKIKRYLDNFYKQFDVNERNTIHNIFYQQNDLVNNNETHFYVLCQKSFGNGDIVNGIKTYKILQKYFKNIYLLVKDDKDYQSTYEISKGEFKITTLSSLNFIYDIGETKQIKKIFIACALPVYRERFDNIPGPKRFLFIDEYNGWRIEYLKDKKNRSVNDDISKSADDSSDDSDDENKHVCNKFNCKKCLKTEHYIQYAINKKIEPQDDSMKFYFVSSGFGKTEKNIPTIGVHIMEEPFKDFSNDLVKFYFKRIGNEKFYFAYFSTISKKKDASFTYLKRFYETIIGLNKGTSSNIIIVDASGYLYRNKKISFVKDDVVEFHERGCYIENKTNNTKILYVNYLSHDDMINLMRTSEPLILLSGDQSFIEGISLHISGVTKIIFYQIQSWKLNLIQQFMKISSDILPANSSLLNLQKIIYNCETESDFPIETVVSIISENYCELIKQSTLVYKHITNQYNIENILVSICFRLMYEDDNTIEIINQMIELYHNKKCFKNEYHKLITYINSKHTNTHSKRKTTDTKDVTLKNLSPNKKIKLVS